MDMVIYVVVVVITGKHYFIFLCYRLFIVVKRVIFLGNACLFFGLTMLSGLI